MLQLPGTAAGEPAPLGFLDLPTEIRFMVYNLSLVFTEEITLRPVFPDGWPENYKTFQSQLFLPSDDGIEGVGLFDNPFCVTTIVYGNPSKSHHPIELALLRTCKLVHDEAAHVLYTQNTFNFVCHLGWLAFLAFSKRLTNKDDLWSLQFGPVSMFSSDERSIALHECESPQALRSPQVLISPRGSHFGGVSEMKYRISGLPITCHAALSIVNSMPGLKIVKFLVGREIEDQDWESLTDFCQLLKNTHCALILENFVELFEQRVPKLHASAIAIFRQYGWTICGEYEVAEGGLSRSYRKKVAKNRLS